MYYVRHGADGDDVASTLSLFNKLVTVADAGFAGGRAGLMVQVVMHFFYLATDDADSIPYSHAGRNGNDNVVVADSANRRVGKLRADASRFGTLPIGLVHNWMLYSFKSTPSRPKPKGRGLSMQYHCNTP